jgi:hypothetical protein
MPGATTYRLHAADSPVSGAASPTQRTKRKPGCGAGFSTMMLQAALTRSRGVSKRSLMKVLWVGDLYPQPLFEATRYVAWGLAGEPTCALLSLDSISKG